ncbi:MAG: c-type cytochrome [Massilia sp.]
MKTSLTIPLMLALAVAGCRTGERGQAGQPEVQREPAAPAPGMQQQQGAVLTQQATQGGPAQALGQAGAAAAPSGGAVSLQAGQQLAANGSPNGVTACVGCHGAQGEGNAAGGFPRIAGMPSYYLGKQLAGYANGARVNPIMQPIAKAMNAQQIRDVSAYYASLGATGPGAGAPMPAGGAAARGSARAQVLALAGDRSAGVQACVNCHGPGGAGEPPVYPYLAGQHASYLTATMTQWKNGQRKTDQSGQMPHIGRALSDADIAALAAYYSALPAPPPAARMVNTPSGSTLKPAIAAAAGAPGPKAPGGAGVFGAGTEQGSPLTGGSQGTGGGGGTQGTLPPPPPIKR